MKLPRLILAFIATICLIFAGNALAQTDININNTNLIRFGGNVTLPDLAAKLRHDLGLTALWGLGAIVSIVFVSVCLAITLIGIPLIPLLSLTTIIASLVGSLGVALFVGQSFYRDRQMSVSQQFLVGLAILTVLALIPFLGGLVVFLVNLFGLGTILLWQFGRAKPQIAA